MRTDENKTGSIENYVTRPSTDESKLDFPSNDQKKKNSDYADCLERQLRTLWSEYIEHQDRHGYTEKTKELKAKYLRLYESYKREKRWKQVMTIN